MSSRTAFHAQQSPDIRHHCGPMQAQGILAAHGIEVTMHELYRSPYHRERDYFFPWHMTHALHRHGIDARLRIWTKRHLINRLIESLRAGRVIALVIRSRKSDCLHWISVWHYDADNEIFSAYDSQDDSAHGHHGNTFYGLSELLSTLGRWPFTFAIEVLS